MSGSSNTSTEGHDGSVEDMTRILSNTSVNDKSVVLEEVMELGGNDGYVFCPGKLKIRT